MKPTCPLPVLVVDDEPQLLAQRRVALRAAGFRQVSRSNIRERRPAARASNRLARSSSSHDARPAGPRVARAHHRRLPGSPGDRADRHHDLEVAVVSMQSGAKDYLVKPSTWSRLVPRSSGRWKCARSVRAASLKTRVPRRPARALGVRRHHHRRPGDVRGVPLPGGDRVVNAAGADHRRDGTGKEHWRGRRRLSGRPGELVTVNTAGLDDTLLHQYAVRAHPRRIHRSETARARGSSASPATVRCSSTRLAIWRWPHK